MCCDFSALNSATIRDPYPLPLIHDLLENFADKRFLATFDLFNGYFQAPCDESSSPLLTFTSSRGLFSFKRLPFRQCR